MPRKNTGYRLKFRRNRGVYVIAWCEAGRTMLKSTGTGDLRQAEKAFEEFRAGLAAQSRPAGPSDPGSFRIEDALSLYGEEHAPSAADPARIGYAIAALIPFWEGRMVGDVTKETCRAYGKFRAKSAGTVRRELGTLRAAFNYAYGEGRITRVPAVHLPAKPEGRDRWLTPNEAAKLLNAARTARGDVRLYLPLFLLIALATGARKESILSLRWPQIDLDQRLIYFNPPGRRQTDKRRVTIPISDKLFGHLVRARKRGTDLGYVVHNSGARIKDIGDSSNGSFGSACERAGLSDVTPHVLRHTCATWMAQRGVPLRQIAGWLGHSESRTTELYAHHHPAHMADAKRAADRRRA